MTDFNVQPQEREIEIDLPGGGSVVVSDMSVELGDTMPTAVLAGGAGTFSNYDLNLLGTVTPMPEIGGPATIAVAFIAACNGLATAPGSCLRTQTLPNSAVHVSCFHTYAVNCTGDEDTFILGAACGAAGPPGGSSVAGGPPTLTFPSFSVSGTADLGLGPLNPTFIVSGDITASMPVTPCPWDCGDGDGNVGIVDFLALLAQWGGTGSACDLGLGNAGVGIEEFLDLLANWGPCP